MLDRLGPKKIVVVSSAPQIRFPDCYGIDMSKMGDFVAFRAIIQLIKEQGKDYLLGEETTTIFLGPSRSSILRILFSKVVPRTTESSITTRVSFPL